MGSEIFLYLCTMKITAVIPVAGRESLLKYTIKRLARQVDVICVGHTVQECEAVEQSGGSFFYLPKSVTIGFKWQVAVDEARRRESDVVMIMGSGAMVSDNWFEELLPSLEDYDMVGSAGISYYHFGKRRQACHWPGYRGGRSIEPIGVGRLVRRSILDKMNWSLYDVRSNKGLDNSSMQKIMRAGGTIGVIKHKAHSVRISKDGWPQKDPFDRMLRLSKEIPPADIEALFPELKDMVL